MKLYKNIDIEDLEKILEEEILPISVTGNNNWETDNRVNNSKEVVYLFSPTTEINTFKQYGMVLLEVDTDAEENKIDEFDTNKNLYQEFITKEVKPEEIKNIYVPEIFKKRIKKVLTKETFEKITFVEISGAYYNNNKEKWQKITKKILKTLDESPLNSTEMNFFRGVEEVDGIFKGNKVKKVVDFKNIIYKGI